MSQVAVIFGMQRCGSNFFLSACRRYADLTVYGEMYHRGGVFPFQQSQQGDYEIKRKLAYFIHNQFPEHGDPVLAGWDFQAPYSKENDEQLSRSLVQFAHRTPNKYFAAIRETAETSRTLLKIFPEHLGVFHILSVLRVQRPPVILMARNPIESFISFKKLVETKKPQDVDTSGLKITFNKAEYYEYKAQLMAYFTSIAEFCADEGIPVTTVSYEWLHAADAREKTDKVREALEIVFGRPVVEGADAGQVKLFRQQDKSSSAAAKVNNPGQLPRGPQLLLQETALPKAS